MFANDAAEWSSIIPDRAVVILITLNRFSQWHHWSHIGARHCCSKSFAGYTYTTSSRHQHLSLERACRVWTLLFDEIALSTPMIQLAMCMDSQMMQLNSRHSLLIEPWLFSSLLISSSSGFYHWSHIGACHCSKSFAGYTHRTSLRHQHMCERPRLKWAPVRRDGWTAAFPWCYGQEDILFYLWCAPPHQNHA